jgi:hypothetical protein
MSFPRSYAAAAYRYVVNRVKPSALNLAQRVHGFGNRRGVAARLA